MVRPDEWVPWMTDMETESTDAYRCEVCGKAFDSEGEVNEHVRRMGLVE